MMKNALKFLSFSIILGALIFTTSCTEDDGGIIIGGDEGSFQVADGMYIAGISGTDLSVTTAAALSSAVVEGPDFGTLDRSGHVTGFVYLEAGSYVFAGIEDQEATSQYGGTATAETGATDEQPAEFTVVALTENGAAFNVATAGVYHVVFDAQEMEAVLVAIQNWGVIGGAVFESACVSNGFNSDVDLAKGDSDADGTTWSTAGIILKGGEYKIRYNDAWKIDRRSVIDDADPYNPDNGYVALTNLGGTLEALEEGGANIALADADAGTYTVTAELSSSGEMSLAITRAGDADECAFDPANYPWGIIGAATQPDGWSSEKKFRYINGDGGVHKWRAVFPLAGGMADNQFKFRTDDTWATKLVPTNVNVTDNTEAGTITDDGDTNADGQWFVADGASGFYYMVISTSDLGATWDLSIDEAEFQFIGEGSPVGNWDAGNGIALTYNDDLASWTGTGAFTTGGWKVFVNQSFDYNLGGATDGSTELEFDASTFTLGADGTYTVTISTADGGVSYTATATQ